MRNIKAPSLVSLMLLLAVVPVMMSCDPPRDGKADGEAVGEEAGRLYFTAKLLDGAPLDMHTMEGKVVLVDFWATWCGPCVAEMPNMMKMYRKYHERGFEIVGISLDDDRETPAAFLKEKKIPWLCVHDEDTEMNGKTMAEYCNVRGIPHMILLDRQGNILSTNARGKRLETLLKVQFDGK